jgi:hypothetical protein
MARRIGVSEIPSDWNQATPEWITDAIVKHHPGARVSEAVLLIVDNGTNRPARFRLRYDQGSGPEVGFAKGRRGVSGAPDSEQQPVQRARADRWVTCWL